MLKKLRLIRKSSQEECLEQEHARHFELFMQLHVDLQLDNKDLIEFPVELSWLSYVCFSCVEL